MSQSRAAIRVLHVDDSREFATTAASLLERANEKIDVTSAADAAEGLEILATGDFDCVVSDYEMPGEDGLEFLERVREHHPDLPFILYTGKGSEDVASEAIRAGVTDYLQKKSGTTQYTVLANRITNAVENYHAQQKVAERDKRLNLFFEQSPLGVIEWDDNFEVVRMNDRAEQILGYDEHDLRGGGWEQIVPPDEQHSIEMVISELLNNKGGYHTVNENLRKDGERIICEWHNRVVTDDAGEVLAIFSQIQDITERQENVRRLETLVETLPGVVYRCENEPGWPMQDIRGEVEELTGYSAETIESRRGLWGEEIIHEEDRSDTWDTVQQAIEQKEPFELTYRIRMQDGTEKWVWERGEGVYGPDGRVEALEGFITDITERRYRESELLALRERMDFALETTDSVLYEIDPETDRETRHGPFERIYGVSESEVPTVESFYERAVHPDDREELARKQTEVIEEGVESVEVEYRTHPEAGPLRWMRSPMATFERDNERAVVGLATDITDLKQRERELERYETIIETSGDPVYTLDSDGYFTYVNDAMVAVSGYDADELVGSHAEKVMTDHHLNRGQSVVGTLVNGDRTRATFEMDLVTTEGKHIPCENHIGLLPGDGELTGTVGILRDISRRKAREEQLERQNERLEEFASVVSHDLRNPLNVAKGRLELAMTECETEHHESINESLERMETLIDDLLSLARQGRRVDETTTVELRGFLKECWENVSTRNAELLIETEQTIQADRNRLRQLLENLLRNAVEHGGQAVRVRIGDLPDGFFVADNGDGIPTDQRDRVFDSGFSTAQSGTGFGLSIAAEIADAHGWDIGVTKSESGGARFEITGVKGSNP